MKGIGLSNVYLRNGFTMEDSDGDETISYENLAGLYLEIGRAIASTPFTLRAEEFRFMRKQLRMSQADIAALFDKTDQAVAKWKAVNIFFKLLLLVRIHVQYGNIIAALALGCHFMKLPDVFYKATLYGAVQK